MVKLIIAFRKPDDAVKFEDVYNDFLALCERMSGVKRRQVCHVFGSPTGEPGFYRLLELYFEDNAAMDAALRSRAGQEAGGELARFGQGKCDLSFAEVYEA
jgi:uncharacterized protein (TIGR02118 family)